MNLQELVKISRIEILPFKSVIQKLNIIPERTSIQIATHNLSKTLDFLSMVHGRFNLNFIPHLPARLFNNEYQLLQTLDSLAEMQVRDIFVIGGDEKSPKGPYSNSFNIFERMHKLGYTSLFKEIGTGIYPSGHPFLSDKVTFEALKLKHQFVTYLECNLDFNPRNISNYISKIRKEGIDKPVIVSALGAVDKKNLFPLLKEFSPRKTIRYLALHPLLLLNLTRGRYTPDKFLESLDDNLAKDNNVEQIRGLIFSTFNSLESHYKWMHKYLNTN
ncbi:hypothetical protein J4217_04330 [Candidatus Pacearchaeota archaeon]|nr:hypothetical protein [Candidatus Pacearchaeota archaeon]